MKVPLLLNAIGRAGAIFGEWRPRLRIVGPNVAPVDVIITVCSESLDIVMNTIRATLEIDYPKDRYRVIVSDDGNSAELKSSVMALALKKPNLYYTARVKNGPEGYKGGNLNHALKFTETLPGGPAEFVAGLDADMIPEKRWLRAVAAHIAQDPKLAMVCPSQVRTGHQNSFFSI